METGPVYCSCGAVILEAATDVGVKPIGSDQAIVFRRKTDFIICPECLSVYSARELLAGSPAEASLVDEPLDDTVIENLERLAAERREEQ